MKLKALKLSPIIIKQRPVEAAHLLNCTSTGYCACYCRDCTDLGKNSLCICSKCECAKF